MIKLKMVLIWIVTFIVVYLTINIVPLVIFYFSMFTFYLISELSLENMDTVREFLEHMKALIALTSSLGLLVAIGATCAAFELNLFERMVGRVKVK